MKKEYGANSYYIGLVQNLYAGTKGCTTLLLQFLYQFEINKNIENFEQCFFNLFEKEVENCKILSQILIDMGGDPQFFSSSRKFVSARSVNYVKDSGRMFLADIELLEINILDLKSALSKVENQAVKEKLKIVLENKKNQLKFLKKEYFKNQIV